MATLVGAVTDPTGAAVPNAKVKVSNPNKGFTRDLVTNSAGEYTAARDSHRRLRYHCGSHGLSKARALGNHPTGGPNTAPGPATDSGRDYAGNFRQRQRL